MHEIVILTIAVALLFDISNGWHDTANAIATVVSTRVLTPMKAVVLAAVMNVVGALLFTAVAKTIGKGIVDPKAITDTVVLAALFAAILWNTWTITIGMPVSSSHALIGGLIGASVAYKGFGVLNLKGIGEILVALTTSPILGLLAGYVLMYALLRTFGTYPASTLNKHFGRLQIFSAALMALSHGSNDAQKAMGIITLSLFSGGYLHSLEVPFWVMVMCAIAMGTGTAMGGWRVIRTMGVGIFKMEPVQGFMSEIAATGVIFGATFFGMPVSTTHVKACSIMGVGATKRFSAVRWGVARSIVLAWIFTLPICIMLSWLLCRGMLFLFPAA